MFRFIAFIIVCLITAAAFIFLPGIPVPTEAMHKKAQEVAAKAEQKLQEYARPADPPPVEDPHLAGSEATATNSDPARAPSRMAPGQSPGETASIYARIITIIDNERTKPARR